MRVESTNGISYERKIWKNSLFLSPSEDTGRSWQTAKPESPHYSPIMLTPSQPPEYWEVHFCGVEATLSVVENWIKDLLSMAPPI